jgi:hypothetical protein
MVSVNTQLYDEHQIWKRSGGRKFGARWLAEETVHDIVKMAWEKAKLRGLGPTFADCTKVVHASLHEWDRTVLKGPKKIIEKLKKELKKMR